MEMLCPSKARLSLYTHLPHLELESIGSCILSDGMTLDVTVLMSNIKMFALSETCAQTLT